MFDRDYVDKEYLISIGIDEEILMDLNIDFPVSYDVLCKTLSPSLLLTLLKRELSSKNRTKIMQALKIFNSTAIANSFNVTNSAIVADSHHIMDSRYVFSSSHVENGDRIKNSSRVENSNDIEDCEGVSFSFHLRRCSSFAHSYLCANCHRGTCNTLILEGEDIKNCQYSISLHNCENVILSKNLKNCNNKILCADLEDNNDFMILNKPVSEKIFQQVKDEISTILDPFKDCMLPVPLVQNWFEQLDTYLFWDAILSTIPFEITFEDKLLVTWITFNVNRRLS